jgi:hypothetical protein
MPRRENSTDRRRPPRLPTRTILVYCGGVRTEPDYFHARRSSVTIRVRQDGVALDALVRAAAAYRDRHPGVFDEVWCVVDVDEFDLDSAAAEARRHQVSLAVSNPCFELWLLLHHADCHGHCNGCAEVQSRLRRHVTDYDKRQLDFNRFACGVGDAIARARALEPTGTAYGNNPSSGVWQVVEQMMELR